MKKFLRISAIVLIVLAGLLVAGMYVAAEVRRAVASPEALAATLSADGVEVRDEPWLEFRPAGRPATAGVIVYPGANCDVRGYAPVLARLARAGYLVVGVPMPFDFAIFAPDRALAVQAAHPEIGQWAIIGHSMGGAMAAQFVHEHPQATRGLILWDSYPPEFADLSGADLPVWNIHRATPDGKAPEKFVAQRHLFPADSRWVAIPGGNHMQFGSFIGGGYVEQWAASIGPDSQHDQVTRATLEALALMVPAAG